jgi:hypothetical protein
MKRFLALLPLVSLYACGGGSSTAPTPSVTAPIIGTSNTMVYVGQTVTFSATGGGTIRWGGDAPGVANVDAVSGAVTGVGTGRVTIWAENAGGRTTRLLRGLPSYNGNWGGTYVINGCQSTGDMATIKFCGNFSSGQVLNMNLTIAQSTDQVTSGGYTLGALGPGSLNASTVAEGGTLPLTGTLRDGSLTVLLQNGRFESPTAGTISGSFDQSWTISGASGFAIIACSIRNMTRSSGAPILFHIAGGENHSLEEMIQRVLVR